MTIHKQRCWWCGNDPLYIAYHDDEWGVPVHDDQKLFEMLTLEAFQAGLSWLTILRKRENFREAFSGFDPARVARYGKRDISRLLKNAGIVRHRSKIEAAINNAQCFLDVQQEFDSFDKYVWSFTDHRTMRSKRRLTRKNIPSISPESELLAKDLKHRGFKFLGPTTCYAHMQASGMVDDHVESCFRYRKR